MSEERVVQETRTPNTVKSLLQDLRQLGIKEGDLLIVHTSLKSLGWVCGGAQTVIMALQASVGKEGTIVMPAQSGDWSDPKEWGNPAVPSEWFDIIYENMPAFDPYLTPTRGMGKVAELFLRLPGTVRSQHPQVSFSANGKLAEVLMADHPLSPQFGKASPLGKLMKANAWVLLLGVGYDSCTSFHLSEALIAKMPWKRSGSAFMEQGERVFKWFEDFDYDNDDFEMIGKAFEVEGNVLKGKVGHAECRLFSMKEGVWFAKRWMEQHRSFNEEKRDYLDSPHPTGRH
jgi:aminoglycoside 3-N-acetyltransferase